MTNEINTDPFALIRPMPDDAEAFISNPLWVMFKQQVLSAIKVVDGVLMDPYQPAELQRWFLGQRAMLKYFLKFVALVQEASSFDVSEEYEPTSDDQVEQIESLIDEQLNKEDN